MFQNVFFMKLDAIIPVDRCRLVKYESYTETMEKSFEGLEKTSMHEIMEGKSYKYGMLLETRAANEKFEVYRPG